MPYPELTVNYGLALKVETTRGTYATPTMAADAIPLAEEPTVEHGYVLPGGRDGVAVGGYGVPPSANPLGRYCRIRFTTELLGSGTATTPPRWARLLQCFAPETVGVSDVSYQPGLSDPKSLSGLVQWGGKQFTIVGAVPESLVIRGAADSPRIMVEATVAGKMQAAPTEQALEAQTFQATNPVPFTGAFTVGGVALKYDEFELDFGLTTRPWRIDAGNLLFGVVTQVNPRITFPGEVEALSTHDPFARQAAPQTALAFSQRLGTTAGNRYLLTGDHVEYVGDAPLPLQSRNGLLYYGLTLRFTRPASGTWMKLSHD
ncbi:MAG TPA: hypothetical protein VNL98_04805 [Gemmatimonadales bacterium]|nr:hypothetical protein [Gemmatimonadales bacterium]